MPALFAKRPHADTAAMSAFGPKRTCASALQRRSAFGGKADIRPKHRNAPNEPKKRPQKANRAFINNLGIIFQNAGLTSLATMSRIELIYGGSNAYALFGFRFCSGYRRTCDTTWSSQKKCTAFRRHCECSRNADDGR